MEPTNVRHLATRGVAPASPVQAPQRGTAKPTSPGSSFADALQQARSNATDVKLSAHAEQRIAQRAISFTEPEQAALRDALDHLDAKGAREALLLRPDAAFVVSVPNRTVVTAVAQDEMGDRVFTGIDSAMLL